jgi:hypothetical protein
VRATSTTGRARLAFCAGGLFGILLLAACHGEGGSGTSEGAPTQPPSSGRCEPTLVHYSPGAGGRPELRSLPWIEVSPSSSELVGYLFYYDALNEWKRRQLPHLRIYTGGTSPDGRIDMKVFWEIREGASADGLFVQGEKLNGSGTFRQHFDGRMEFPSIIDVPSPGCWRLTLTAGQNKTGYVTVRAVSAKRG